MIGKFAYWFVSIYAGIIIITGIGMFAIEPHLVTIPAGAILTVIGMVIIRHMSRYETYEAWLRGIPSDRIVGKGRV